MTLGHAIGAWGEISRGGPYMILYKKVLQCSICALYSFLVDYSSALPFLIRVVASPSCRGGAVRSDHLILFHLYLILTL